MLAFLVFGGWLFWLILVVVFIGISLIIEDKRKDEFKFGLPSLILILLAGGFYFQYQSIVKDWWESFSLLRTSLWIAGWLLVGFVWSFYRWLLFVRKKAREYHAATHSNKTMEAYMPRVDQNKALITGWVIFFPFSIFNYVISDLLRDFFDAVLAKLTFIYDKITKSQFK